LYEVLAAVRLHFDWELFAERLFGIDLLWHAIVTTVVVSIIVQVLATAVGVVSALSWMSRYRILRILARVYVMVIRATPPIVTIFYVYFATPLLFGVDLFPGRMHILGLQVSGAIVAGILALTVNDGAFNSEIIRAGITSIDPGQMDAAQALGMRQQQAMRRIILPQAVRVIIPPLGNQFNSLVKMTSLLAFIGVQEMFLNAQLVYARTFRPAEVFTAVAIWYIVLLSLWNLVQVRIERRLARGFQALDRRATTRVKPAPSELGKVPRSSL